MICCAREYPRRGICGSPWDNLLTPAASSGLRGRCRISGVRFSDDPIHALAPDRRVPDHVPEDRSSRQGRPAAKPSRIDRPTPRGHGQQAEAVRTSLFASPYRLPSCKSTACLRLFGKPARKGALTDHRQRKVRQGAPCEAARFDQQIQSVRYSREQNTIKAPPSGKPSRRRAAPFPSACTRKRAAAMPVVSALLSTVVMRSAG